jgi:hypothetical protein
VFAQRGKWEAALELADRARCLLDPLGDRDLLNKVCCDPFRHASPRDLDCFIRNHLIEQYGWR